MAIAVLWLATLRRESWRRHLLHVPVLLPQIVLPLWFFAKQGGWERAVSLAAVAGRAGSSSAWRCWSRWAWPSSGSAWGSRSSSCCSWSSRSGGAACGGWRASSWPWPGSSQSSTSSSPEGTAGGWLLKNRLSLYPFLLLIPGLSPRLGRRSAAAAAGGLALLALVNLGYLVHGYRDSAAEVDGFLAGLAPVAPDTRVFTLLFERDWPTDVLSHATGYVALEKGLIDWDNYEAKTDFFPVRFRDAVDFPDTAGLPSEPGSYRVKPNLTGWTPSTSGGCRWGTCWASACGGTTS